MLVVVLGTVSALLYGVADFFGGFAARSRPSLQVTLWSFVISGAVVAPALALVDAVWSAAAVAAGAIGGLLGASCLWAYYRALAAGPVGVVAPAVALLSAALPVLVAIVRGEPITPVLAAGLVVVVVAGVLLALEPDARRRPSRRTLGLVVVAGLSSALYFVVINAAPVDSGLVPLVADTVAGVAALGVASLVSGRDRIPARRRGPSGAMVASGLAQGVASVLLVLALHLPALAVVGALAALYPVATVGLGHLVLRERTRPVQVAGLVVAIAGVALVALGRP